MLEPQTDLPQSHSLSDFLSNSEAHIAHVKETRTPEVLTINGRAELVILDADSYQSLLERARSTEAIAAIRVILSQNKSEADTSISSDELERRHRVLDELTAETERLGLYR